MSTIKYSVIIFVSECAPPNTPSLQKSPQFPMNQPCQTNLHFLLGPAVPELLPEPDDPAEPVPALLLEPALPALPAEPAVPELPPEPDDPAEPADLCWACTTCTAC